MEADGVFEPKLDRQPMDFSGITYSLIHEDSYVDMNCPDIDDTHIHDCFEVYINISGDVSFFVKNHIYPIERGDIIFTRPNEFHRCIYNKSCVHEHFCLWFDMGTQGDSINELITGKINRISPSEQNRGKIISTLYSFRDAGDNKLNATVCLLNLLSVLTEEICNFSSESRQEIPKDLQLILDYINSSFPEITNVNELYDKFFISAATLNRWFMKYLRMPPKTYVKYVKLANAKRLLSEGKSVTSVCFECGYSDCSHFISVFKNSFGITPLQYKNDRQ